MIVIPLIPELSTVIEIYIVWAKSKTLSVVKSERVEARTDAEARQIFATKHNVDINHVAAKRMDWPLSL